MPHDQRMPPRTNTLADADRFVVWLRLELGQELRLARLNAGATLQTVADRLGWSKSKVSRLERGRSRSVTITDLARLAAVVGLRPSVRLFLAGQPLRDAGQVELLAALNARMHARWRSRHEVVVPIEGDLRAADQMSSIPGCRLMVEAYRRFVDSQAQSRAARAKQRDLGADRLLLLLEDTHANRRAVRSAGTEAARSFPVSQRACLAALAAGRDPGGDSIVFLRRIRGAPARGVAPPATNSETATAPTLAVSPGASQRV